MRTGEVDAARRGYGGIIRGTIKTSNDTLLMQTVDVRAMHGELIPGVERPQMYGFNSVPVDEDGDGKASEAFFGFINGNRSHAVVLAEGDRRSRPKGGEGGQVGLWHYKGATLTFTMAGYAYDAGPEKKPHAITVGNDVLTVADMKFSVQVGGSGGPAFVIKNGKCYAGGDPDNGGTFLRVMTEDGLSDYLWAKV